MSEKSRTKKGVVKTSKHQEMMVNNDNKINLQSGNQWSGNLQQNDPQFHCHIPVQKTIFAQLFSCRYKVTRSPGKVSVYFAESAQTPVQHTRKKTTTKHCLPRVNTRLHVKFLVSDTQSRLNIQCF